MKKEWSSNWLSSVQPRKQRKYRHNAPLHTRQSFVRSNLSPDLRKRYSKRSMQLRKGDEVRVMRGSFKGKLGTVERVDLRKSRIYVDEFKIKKVDGSEVLSGLEPSNLMITKLKLDDKKRQAILSRREDALAEKESAKAEPKHSGKEPASKPKAPAKPSPKARKPDVPASKKPAPAAKKAATKPARKSSVTKPRKSSRKATVKK